MLKKLENTVCVEDVATAKLHTSFSLELTRPTDSAQLFSSGKARFFIMALLNKARQTLLLTTNTTAAMSTSMDSSAPFYEKFLLFFGVAF